MNSINDRGGFHLLPEHIALLTSSRCYVDYEEIETGAPAIDPKRPYGNSDVANDVAEILGWDEIDYDDEADSDLYERAMKLHRETATALEIILATKSFEPGVYKTKDRYSINWERVADLP